MMAMTQLARSSVGFLLNESKSAASQWSTCKLSFQVRLMYHPASYLCSRTRFSLLAPLFHAWFKLDPAELRLSLQFIEGYWGNPGVSDFLFCLGFWSKTEKKMRRRNYLRSVVMMDSLSAVKHGGGVRTNLMEGALGFLQGAKNVAT